MDPRSYFFPSQDQPLLTKHARWRQIAKLIKLSDQARLRLEWMIYHEGKAQGNVALTARHFGISRKVVHTWLKRFDGIHLQLLEAHARRPQHTRQPSYTRLEVYRMIELRRRYPTAGRDKLVILHQEDYGEPIKLWAARRIIRDFKLHAERAIKTKRQQAQGRITKHKRITELVRQPFTGFLVEGDGITIYYPPYRRYVLTAVDYHARIGFAFMYKTKGSRNAADFLRRLYLLLGGRIENLHIDNGSEFKKDFLKAAKQLGITLYHARPYQPKDKPLIERFNGIIQQEFIDLGDFSVDPETFNQRLTDWLIYYNFKRPHWSLGLRRPVEVATMKTARVLPMWSPMTSSCNFPRVWYTRGAFELFKERNDTNGTYWTCDFLDYTACYHFCLRLQTATTQTNSNTATPASHSPTELHYHPERPAPLD